ncbi:hypothetical protein FZ942_26605 [Azospirillum lipoferum]|uniref:Uncharacterized protein n=2 Tax=Azospirillaceae TaxID=2829815 RepID=A0A5A9GGB1_AZOLI|nr:hypothetical protein FZ942_26605 [Azospirillum lipoferum]
MLLVEQAGFLARRGSNFGVAATVLGLPDVGILSMRNQVNAVQSIANAVSIPVRACGGTGFGNALNTFHIVRMPYRSHGGARRSGRSRRWADIRHSIIRHCML